jgi:hypothetical protein
MSHPAIGAETTSASWTSSRPARELEATQYLPSELRARIQHTLCDLEAPAFVRAVLGTLRYLASPCGSPVSLSSIQSQLRRSQNLWLSDRLIKRAIKELIETHGIAIGAARGSAHGYYFITTDAQAQDAVAPLMAEIRSLATRCRALSPSNHYIQHLLGQMEVL